MVSQKGETGFKTLYAEILQQAKSLRSGWGLENATTLGGTPETNVGEKLAQSLDSVAVESTEPAEAAANAAAAVGQTAPSVEAATAAEAVGKAEPAAAAVNTAEAVGQTELERAEPATTAVKAG